MTLYIRQSEIALIDFNGCRRDPILIRTFKHTFGARIKNKGPPKFYPKPLRLRGGFQGSCVSTYYMLTLVQIKIDFTISCRL